MKAKYLNKYPKGYCEPFNKRVKFRLVNLKPDPDNKGRYLLPRTMNVPSVSRTIFTDEDGNVQTIHIAFTDGQKEKEDGSPVLRYDLEFGQFNNGEMVLDPKNAGDAEKFRYMNHCSFNASSPWRSNDVTPIFERIDEDAIAIQKSELRKARRKAENIVSSLTDEELPEKWALISSDTDASAAIMRNGLEDYAEKYPTEFIKLTGDPVVETINLCKVAKKLGVIENNSKDRIFAFSETGEVITEYTNAPNSYKELAEFLLGEEHLLHRVKSLVASKE